MFSVNELLDLAKARAGDVSDYRIAQLLGLKPQHISSYRSGRTRPENSIAMRLAELCGLDPVEVVAWVNIERSKAAIDREFWALVLARGNARKPRRAHA